MLGKLKKLWRGEEGFTLVELMVVVIILGILAAIAVPMYLKSAETARENAALTSVSNMKSVIDTWAAGDGDGQYPVTTNIQNVMQNAGINWTGTNGGVTGPWGNAFEYVGTVNSYYVWTGPDPAGNYFMATQNQTAQQVPPSSVPTSSTASPSS